MPMAISFVGAGVIWKFIYEYRGPGDTQIGLLNAIIVSFGYEPQAWITIPFWNNFFLCNHGEKYLLFEYQDQSD